MVRSMTAIIQKLIIFKLKMKWRAINRAIGLRFLFEIVYVGDSDDQVVYGIPLYFEKNKT